MHLASSWIKDPFSISLCILFFYIHVSCPHEWVIYHAVGRIYQSIYDAMWEKKETFLHFFYSVPNWKYSRERTEEIKRLVVCDPPRMVFFSLARFHREAAAQYGAAFLYYTCFFLLVSFRFVVVFFNILCVVFPLEQVFFGIEPDTLSREEVVLVGRDPLFMFHQSDSCRRL